MQMLLTWSRLIRDWGELRSSYNLFNCFKSDTENYVILFYSQLLFEFFKIN